MSRGKNLPLCGASDDYIVNTEIVPLDPATVEEIQFCRTLMPHLITKKSGHQHKTDLNDLIIWCCDTNVVTRKEKETTTTKLHFTPFLPLAALALQTAAPFQPKQQVDAYCESRQCAEIHLARPW